MAQVALPWVLTSSIVSAPALDREPTDDEITALEEHYTPHGPYWF